MHLGKENEIKIQKREGKEALENFPSSHHIKKQQIINFQYNQILTNDSQNMWNGEINIKAEASRSCQQFITPLITTKNIINGLVNPLSKSNYSISTELDQIYSKQRSKLQQVTMSSSNASTSQQINHLTIFIQEKGQNLFTKQEENEQNKKYIEVLKFQRQNNYALLMKILFNYYFQMYHSLEVIIRSKAFQPQNNNKQDYLKEAIFQNQRYQMRDYNDNKTFHSIYCNDIMCPPVICELDFHYAKNLSTDTSRLELKKKKDIYQTEKPKCMIRLQLAIRDLSTFIYKLVKIIELKIQQRDVKMLELQKFNIKSQVIEIISQINKYIVSYETQSILLLMCDYVIDSLSCEWGKKFDGESLNPNKSQSQKSSSNLNQQSFKIEQIVLNYSFDFLSKLYFYNFVIGLYHFHNKQNLPMGLFISNNIMLNGSFVDMKMEMFSKTIKNPNLLMRFFKQSINFKVSCVVSQLIPSRQFNMFNFYRQICPIKSQQELISMYIMYQCSFMVFGSQIVLDLVDGQNLLFKEIFNYSRYLTSNFIGHFIIKTLKVIDSQIQQSHISFFYKLFLQKKANNERWKTNYSKIQERINISAKKIDEYLNPPKEKQFNVNSKYIRTESEQMLKMFRDLNNTDKKGKNKTIHQEINQIKKIYKYATILLNKSFFNSDVFKNFYFRLQKKFGLKDWSFIGFLQWTIPPGNGFSQRPNIQKDIENLLKEYKIGQIITLKLFNMFRTLHLYSFANRIQFEQLRKLQGSRNIIPRNYLQLLNKLDTLFINLTSKKRIGIAYLKDNSTSDFQVSKNLEIEYDLGKMINNLYRKFEETSSQVYPQTLLNFENANFENYLFIPTKSCTSLQKQDQLQNMKFNFTQKKTNQFDRQRNLEDRITKHPYFERIRKKQNIKDNYNFNLNQIMNKHIHRNRLTIFPPKLAAEFFNEINLNLVFPDFFAQSSKKSYKQQQRKINKTQQIKYMQSQLNDRMEAFAKQTFNRSIKKLLTNQINPTKKDIYNQKNSYSMQIITSLISENNLTETNEQC